MDQSQPTSSMTMSRGEQRQRDVASLRMIGGFLMLFGILVWIGLFWEQGPEGRFVNVVSGALLLGFGAAAWKGAGRLAKRSES